MKKKALLLIFIISSITAGAQESSGLYRTSIMTYGGLPVSVSDEYEVKLLVNLAYAVGYSEELMNPLWAAYRLGNLKGENEPEKWERPSRFFTDSRVNAPVDHDSYTSSGYSRGHLVPNASVLEQYGQMAQLETFLVTNICPQKQKLNGGIWMRLESKIRDELSQDDEDNKEVHDLYVITGPVFREKPVKRLASGVAIPDAFFKIIAFRKGYFGTVKAVSFIMPQEPEERDFESYFTSIDEIERLTGFDFFPELSSGKQNNLEIPVRDFNLEKVSE